MLKDKYQELLDLGLKLAIADGYVNEEAGILKLGGTAEYQMQKDILWDKIKSFDNWEKEIQADIKVSKTDVYGEYQVQPGDSLSKISKRHFGNANRYMEIFNINTDQLNNPNMIKVGQVLKLPNKSEPTA